MSEGCPTKLERILMVLRNNPGKWMSVSEIAGLCNWKYITANDVRANLRDDTLPVEQRDFSTNANPAYKYRYMEDSK